jgi:hypothetical protein
MEPVTAVDEIIFVNTVAIRNLKKSSEVISGGQQRPL